MERRMMNPPPAPRQWPQLTPPQIAGLVVLALLLCCSSCGMLLWLLNFVPFE
jgi:hypothetical protein